MTWEGSTTELRVARWETGNWHALGGAQGQRVYAPEPEDADIHIQLARWTGRQWERVAQDVRASSRCRCRGAGNVEARCG